MNRRKTLLSLAAVGAALALPASALAITTPVTAVVGTDLSLAAATPSQMTLTHPIPGASNSVVSITATTAWTLSVADANVGANAGHMIKTLGTTALGNPLQWSLTSGSGYANLTGTATAVTTGTGVATKTVYFQQALATTDAVAVGDTYGLSVNFTVA